MQFFLVVRATFFTLKRTRAVWLAIVAPIFIVCLRILFIVKGEEIRHAWDNWMEANYSFWTGIILLLTMSLDIALVVDIDRSAHIWKQLFALPISRTSVYFAKFIVAIALTFFSGILLFLLSLIVGYIFALVNPKLGFTFYDPDIPYYLWVILLETVASFFIIAVYLCVSMLAKNFILPVSLGIMGSVVNLVAYDSTIAQKFSPWMYALDVARILAKTPQTQAYLGWPLPIILAISVLGSLLLILLGVVEFNRRDIY